VIVTGGSQGVGSGVVQAFLERNYSVVATSGNEGVVANGNRFERSGDWTL